MLFKLFAKAHQALYRLSKGRIGSKMGTGNILVLFTIGRKSGKERRTPLMYFETKDDKKFIVASYGGSPNHPAWYLNIKKDPNVRVQIKDKVYNVKGVDAKEPKRTQYYKQAVDTYKAFAAYEKATDRVIPVVVLEPRK